MKPKEMIEGHEALSNFTKTMKALFRVPKTQLKKQGKRKPTARIPKH